MSKEEYGEKYCANCVSHNDCIFLNQGSKCMCVHDAEDAWEDCQEYMIEKACEWLFKNFYHEETMVDCIAYKHENKDIYKMIEHFKKAMAD